tara:strand:+ start:100 stop:792 length:693 start_codon:yes stop_codon:yes gene_type:complete
MALPKLQTPTYELKLETLDSPIQFRPYLVKEEKILMIASETGDEKSIIRALTQIVKSCTFNKIDVESLPVFDIEYLFLNIRSKSVGESVKINVTCPDDKKTTVSKEVNINDVKVKKNENHKNIIDVNDTIKIVMKYPTLKEITSIDTRKTEDLFKVIPKCIKSVYEGEKIIEDFTDEEISDFVNNLNSKQFKSVQDFFMTMPRLKHDIEVDNPVTKVKSTVTLEGVQSFF